MQIEGSERRSSPWPAWALTTVIDARAHWRTAWEAISRHRSQLPAYHRLLHLPAEEHEKLWGGHVYYRVFGPTEGAGMEDDLFAGLRDREPAVSAIGRLAARLGAAG
jgi:hypothetical protein